MNEQLKKFTAELKEQMLAALKSEEIQNSIAETKAAEEGGTFEVVISTADLDRSGEIIDQNGWILDNYKKNPVVLWAHNYSQLPIGVCDEISIQDGKLIAKGRFALHEFAQEVRKLYDQKMLFATSVGLISLESDGKTIKKAELLEFSFVPVPANPYALSLAKSAELNVEELMTKGILIEDKGAISDELDEEDKWMQKWEKWSAFSDIYYAFCGVYFDENTSPDQFNELLKETIDLMSKLLDNAAAGDTTAGKILEATKDMTNEKKEKIMAFIDIKSGREISGKNIDALKGALGNILKGAISINGLLGDDAIDLAGYTGEEPENEGEEGKDAQKGKQLTIESVKDIIGAAVKEILQGGEGNSQEDGAAPKSKSNNSGSGEAKELDSYLETRQILRSVDNVLNAGLERCNKKIREKSKK